MKKLFSLLLALTMVLSLVVVPARAAATDISVSSTATVARGATTTITATAPTSAESKTYVALRNDGYTQGAETWNWTASDGKITLANETTSTVTVNGVSVGDTTLTCHYTTSFTKESDTINVNKDANITVTVSDPQSDSFTTAVGNAITYNGRVYPAVSGSITGYKYSGDLTETWSIKTESLSNYKNVAFDGTPNGAVGSTGTLTVNGTTNDASAYDVKARFSYSVAAASVSVASNPTDKEVIAGGTLTLTATCAAAPSDAKYLWYVDSATDPASNKTSSFTLPSDTAAGTHSVKCVVMASDGVTKIAETTVNDIKVIPNTFTIKVTASQPSVSSTTTPVTATATMYNGTTAITDSTELAKITNWRLTKTDTVGAFTTNYTTGNTMTLYAVKSGTAYITATATYKGKTITTALNAGATVTSSLLSYTLPAIQSGSYGTYSNSELLNYANAIVGRPLRGFQSISAFTQNDKNNLGTLTATSSGVYAQYTFSNVSAPRKVGLAQFAATAYSDSTAYTIYFNVPVEPTGTTYPDQYPEPVASYGNTYRYYVQVPSGYYSYYVVGTPNQATRPTDWSQGSSSVYYATTTATTNLYPLTDANFVSGKCTLWIVTADSSGRLSCGQLTVYQKNHDIKYNGVVGGTVQFKHNDFTTFMNEMYGTNTTSYLTFNSVKFTSVPNATTQGTLYYNGVAMTTGYGSNYFNTSTAVTNLDNVSFSVSSRVPSTTKEIRIPFTLYATRYNSYGTSAGTSVTYSGVVVISLVREDVTFTVAPGDSVRFTDSAFLTYLRSASGINYNYNIDYVTFDQSAVNALNEGVLYAYSTGFNAVKTTDRFYYTTTSYNQNALSDVTFRASTYAKTGTTVYIPFTITAKYGTSSATRQVTGTVAIKIAQTMNFVDVKTSDYFYDSVKWAVNDNITKGTSATTFSPNNTCTRAEIVTFLWRAAGSPTPTITRNPFTDVKYPVGSDFYNAILWASQNGITAGKTTTTFAPNDNCTRAQIVTFLWRYAKKPLGYYTNPFNDVNKTEYAAYYDAILWAAGKGIATGNTPKTFNPDGTCTRAEAVTFLYRYESTK